MLEQQPDEQTRPASRRGQEQALRAGAATNRGEFTAWDPVQAKAVWTIKEDLPLVLHQGAGSPLPSPLSVAVTIRLGRFLVP